MLSRCSASVRRPRRPGVLAPMPDPGGEHRHSPRCPATLRRRHLRGDGRIPVQHLLERTASVAGVVSHVVHLVGLGPRHADGRGLRTAGGEGARGGEDRGAVRGVRRGGWGRANREPAAPVRRAEGSRTTEEPGRVFSLMAGRVDGAGGVRTRERRRGTLRRRWEPPSTQGETRGR